MWPVPPLGASGFHRNAWLSWLPPVSSEAPAASPEELSAKAVLALPPRVPRSSHVPVVPFGVNGFHSAACASRPGGTCESPATWPRSLFAKPSLSVPASVPRSRGPPACVQMKA